MHKRVCGTKPFRWPELSKKEIDEMVAYSKKPARVGKELTTWLSYVVPYVKVDGTVRDLQERERAFRVSFSNSVLPLLIDADCLPLYLSCILNICRLRSRSHRSEFKLIGFTTTLCCSKESIESRLTRWPAPRTR